MESTGTPAPLVQLQPTAQLTLTRAMLDESALGFFNSAGLLAATGFEAPAVVGYEPGEFTCRRAAEAMRVRGYDLEKLARWWMAIDADFRAAMLRAVADHRLDEASSCPGQQVTAHPHVVRGPNGGLIFDVSSPAGLVAPTI